MSSMMYFIAFEMILFAVGVILITIGATSLLAHTFNGYYKVGTGIVTLLIGIALVAVAWMLTDSNSFVYGVMSHWR